jgi:steroid 5-alpha reductase family enzyme
VTGSATHWFLTGLALTAGAEVALFLLTWMVGRTVGRWNVVDVTWGLSFVVVAAVSFAWSAQAVGASGTRRALALALPVVWGLRLAGYIAVRSRGKGEDPRYEEILSRAPGSRAAYALRVVMLPQAFLSWLVSIPVQLAMYERPSTAASVVMAAGCALWAVGVVCETVGDAQMAAFRGDPANKGKVMDRGLWRYTRHPNYFGDACVWFGLYLLAFWPWPGPLALVSPLTMLYFLYFRSGKGLLEKSMAESRPGYREYMQRTSGFVPLPPRRG